MKTSALRTWLRKERAREAVEGRAMPPFPSEDHGPITAFVVRELWARDYHVRFHFYGQFVEPPLARIPLGEAGSP